MGYRRNCIAGGADSVFAQEVLSLGGTLEVLLPAAGYREHKVKADHAPVFDELICRATTVRVMSFEKSIGLRTKSQTKHGSSIP